MYKDTEPRCIEQALQRLVASQRTGTGFIAEILHELAWSQCLGNANHRTAMLFLVDFVETCLGSPQGPKRPAQGTNDWVIGSQAVIRRRGEWGYNQAGLEDRHREQCDQWVRRTLGGQSEALMMSGPQRLLAFLSGSSSSSVRER